ncbi:dihydrofolate reductase [Catalinimonas niigatensis]|uniref:dihydrofolate reductase n=1 Tax=Catalinimonas niigatensis TaxID=1397264 RepID=UPI002666E5D7|nr:dihydrofolate reductase [Catalinimonas niigatensis]WPP48249.1 dihydrofolate reductase [Catalinimonas niigatensis]
MIRSIIAAKSDNGVIGKENDLVWHMPADLKFFKSTTRDHYVIMGRKTFESMNGPLPHRTHIIITRHPDYQVEGCFVVDNIPEAFKIAEEHQQKEVFILGGAEIYRQTINKADKMYITEIKASFEGDAFFPEIDLNYWKEHRREEHEPDAKNPHPYAFVEYLKK